MLLLRLVQCFCTKLTDEITLEEMAVHRVSVLIGRHGSVESWTVFIDLTNIQKNAYCTPLHCTNTTEHSITSACGSKTERCREKGTLNIKLCSSGGYQYFWPIGRGQAVFWTVVFH